MTVKMKKIAGWEDYLVDTNGRVYSNKRGELVELTQTKGTTGYYNVGFSNGATKQTFSVHRLIAMAFIPNRKKLEIVNHLSGNKLDNSATNLEWTSRGGNAKHAAKQLYPKQVAERKAKKDNDMKMKMSIINHSHSACTADPVLFHSIYKTVMGV